VPSRLRQAQQQLAVSKPIEVMCLDCALHVAELEGDITELLALLMRRGMN